MLSRRHIRIKVLQALYAFYRDDEPDAAIAIKNLNHSLQRIYDLYLHDISSIKQILLVAEERIENAPTKLQPSAEDLNPNLAFVQNRVLQLIKKNVRLNDLLEKKGIGWRGYHDQFKKIFARVRDDQQYLRFMNLPARSFADEKKIVKYIYASYICENEFLHQYYEDEYIHWADDLDAAQMMTTKTLKTMKQTSDAYHPLVKLFKDKDDEDFGPTLFRKVVNHNDEYERLISERTKNWEADRIAIIDNLLMKMAIAEFMEFQEIPIKVTLNEYIELSKQYSTPKSANFVNGVLDKLVIDLKEKNSIVKVGRGLL
jgi:N utilization substance protein B